MPVPVKLRMATLRLSLLPGVGAAARAYYDWVSRICLQSLRLPTIADAYIRGGRINFCQPGISDIDVTVCLNSQSDPPRGVAVFRRLTGRWPRVKRIFLAPGEITSPSDRTRHLLNRERSAIMIQPSPA